jgi:uncharacterized lipoprotein NlpE involved in copper resistance
LKYTVFRLICFSLFFFSCGNRVKKEDVEVATTVIIDANVVDAHNSQNSLDWSGTYKGIIPCADCEGIVTEIDLNKDMTFISRTKYQGKGNQKVFEEKGSFVWDKTGSFIFLKGVNETPKQYKVGENKLIQLDMKGKVITGSLADKYILKK